MLLETIRLLKLEYNEKYRYTEINICTNWFFHSLFLLFTRFWLNISKKRCTPENPIYYCFSYTPVINSEFWNLFQTPELLLFICILGRRSRLHLQGANFPKYISRSGKPRRFEVFFDYLDNHKKNQKKFLTYIISKFHVKIYPHALRAPFTVSKLFHQD